jgi:uncharacterized repeat protein (TIGR03803 family)
MSLRQSCLRSPLLGATLLLLLAVTGTAQVVTVLVNFGKTAPNPYFVTLVQGRDGRLYGSTLTDDVNSAGTVFAFDPNTGLRFIIHRFDNTTGSSPQGGVTLGTDGNFYGAAQFGGTANFGVLFKLTPNGTYTVLHNFAGGTDGLYPNSPPVQATNGNFYGTTGYIDPFGYTQSTAYQYTPSGVFTSFGDIPDTLAPLIQATDGNLYGMAFGAGSCGGIFELSTSGALLNVYPLLCGADGYFPVGPTMQADDGNFYGTTQRGGDSDVGTIYKMSQSGAFSVLYSFPRSEPYPESGFVQGTDGNLYGSSWGAPSTLFQITLSGSFTLLDTLTSEQGLGVGDTLLQNTNGMFYGTAYGGGNIKNSYGTLFSLDMGLPPFISLVKNQGQVGSLVQILGQGLTGSTSVTFNGIPATSFHVSSGTYMTAVVPARATTGPVVVTTPGGTLTSNRNFQIVR